MTEYENKLIAEIKTPSNNFSQAKACKDIAKIEGAKDNDAIINILIWALDSKYDLTRAFAIEGLGNLKVKRAVEKIKKNVDDSSHLVASCAVRALGKLGDENLIPFLIEKLPLTKDALTAVCKDSGDENLIPFLIKKLPFTEGALREICKDNLESENCKMAAVAILERHPIDYEFGTGHGRGGPTEQKDYRLWWYAGRNVFYKFWKGEKVSTREE